MDYTKITSKDVNGLLFEALEVEPQMGWIDSVSMLSPSMSAAEKYAWLGQVPQMREWKGKRVLNRLAEYDYTIRNKPYELSLAVHADDMFRAKVPQIQTRIGDMITRSTTHWASLLTDLIIANDTCYDGQAMFSASHSSGKSGTQSNLLTKTNLTTLDFTVTGKPTVLEMASALIELAGYFQTLKDDTGELINENARSFTVVVPSVAYMAAATQAVSKQVLASGVENPVYGSGLNFNVQLNYRLNSTSAVIFYIFRNDTTVKPFIRQQEGDLVSRVLDENSDHYFDTKEILYGIDTKRAAGYGLWQYGLSANGTT